MNLSSLFNYEGSTLEIVIWSLFVGIVIGSFGAFYNKRILGAFVRRLLSENANSPENAKSLDDVGFGNNIFVRIALREKSTYRKVVHAAESEERFNVMRAKYYIPSECTDRANMVYDTNGTSLVGVLVAILAFLIMALVSFTVIPQLVSMVESLFV